MSLKFHLVSSLEKVFPDREPAPMTTALAALRGDSVSFQLAVCPSALRIHELPFTVSSPIREYLTVRSVQTVPVRYATVSAEDGNYISDKPGMYPDLLLPVTEQRGFIDTPGTWSALWIEAEIPEDARAGVYPVEIQMQCGEETFIVSTSIEIIDAVLPEQTLKHTEWFHCDGIAQYYGLTVWSEPFMRAVRAQIQCAVRRGVNMLLIPIFTPPLDTRRGGERLTVQLVDVTVTNGTYSFSFDRLKAFLDMARDCGIQYFEMAHLFSQWGAENCPKIIATVDGTERKIFGWDTAATGDAYRNFLAAFLPALTAKIEEWGLKDRVVFHISDEPSEAALPQYQACREMVQPFLKGYPIMDAMSEYEYYEKGICETPVVATTALAPFLTKKRPEEFWIYYCVGQFNKVANRFIAMPSSRNRILGLQMYKFRVKGFLQWGFNFYNSVLSLYPVDPFATTDGDSSFPAGDPFIVYPGENLEPWESLRLVVLSDALRDVRALTLLESLTNREYVLSLIEEGLSEPLSFTAYPQDGEYILRLMNRVRQEIKARI